MATIRRSKQAGLVQVQAADGSRRRLRSRNRAELHKPHGVIHPRVQKVGPEHFGIVAVDCAKARSKWMFSDFYGNELVAPTEVEHNQVAFASAVVCLREAIARHGAARLRRVLRQALGVASRAAAGAARCIGRCDPHAGP